MAGWLLQTLGAPRLWREGDNGENAEARLSGSAFVTLASLALDAKTTRREAIAVRCWPESPKARDYLRLALFYLRKALGKDALIEDRATVRLAPNAVTTDWDRILTLRQTAKTTDTGERARLLRQAALLLCGEFLEGIDISDEDDDGWLLNMRQKANDLAADTLLELADACVEAGDRRGGYEAAREAFALAPERRDAQDAVIALADGADEKRSLLQLARKFALEDVLPRIWEREASGEALTVREERALDAALSARLREMPKASADALRALSVFPQSFTAEQAEGAFGIVPETLQSLLSACLISRTSPADLAPTEPRYEIVSPVRERMRTKISTSEREKLRARHARYITHWLMEIVQYSARHSQSVSPETGHLSAAVDWHLEQPLSFVGVEFIEYVRYRWRGCQQRHPENLRLRRALPYLNAAIASSDPRCVSRASYTAGLLELEALNFRAALHYVLLFYDCQRRHPEESIKQRNDALREAIFLLLESSHNAPDDALFDETAAFARMVYFPEEDVLFNIHFQTVLFSRIAENYMARGRYSEALSFHEEAFQRRERLREANYYGPYRYALDWYQKANILLGLGRTAEAKAFYDRALDDFTELARTDSQFNHGAASCLRNLAGLARTEGRFGEAKSNLRTAQELFSQVGDPAAVASCWIVLGDVHRDKGERDEAERLYRDALTFWRERDHSRWIATVEERLKNIGRSVSDSGAEDALEKGEES